MATKRRKRALRSLGDSRKPIGQKRRQGAASLSTRFHKYGDVFFPDANRCILTDSSSAGGAEHAEEEPLYHQTDQERARRTGGAVAAIYIDVSAGRPRQDRAVGQPGIVERRYRRPARRTASDRQQVAPAFLHPAIIGT